MAAPFEQEAVDERCGPQRPLAADLLPSLS